MMTAQCMLIHPTISPELMTSIEEVSEPETGSSSLSPRSTPCQEILDDVAVGNEGDSAGASNGDVGDQARNSPKVDCDLELKQSENEETMSSDTKKTEAARGRRRSRSGGRKKGAKDVSSDKKRKKKKNKEATVDSEVTDLNGENDNELSGKDPPQDPEKLDGSIPVKEKKTKKKRKKLKASKSDGALKAVMKIIPLEVKDKSIESSKNDFLQPTDGSTDSGSAPQPSTDDAGTEPESAKLGLEEPPTSPMRLSTKLPQRSNSFTSPMSANERKKLVANAKSLNAHGLLHWVDGRRLNHWDRTNFELKRSKNSSQVRYRPIEGEAYFKRVLDKEEYSILRLGKSEQPHLSKYNRMFPTGGHFCCKACGKAIYSHKSKIHTFDGWPGFGACVSGAIELVTVEQRQRQSETRTKSAIKIQKAFRGMQCRRNLTAIHIQRVFRGSLWRGRVSKALEIVIEKMMASDGDKTPGVDEPRVFDILAELTKATHENATASTVVPGNEESQGDSVCVDQAGTTAAAIPIDESRKEDDSLGDVISASQVSAEYNELRCMRCKSHLGNVLREKNFGRSGQLYHERHRVNGKALKFVDDDLPQKRIRIQEELPVLPLEDQSSQGRNSGLLAKVNALKKALPPSKAGSFTMSKPEGVPRRKFRPQDPLSQSCHQPSRGNPRMTQRPSLRRHGSSDGPLEMMKSTYQSSRTLSTNQLPLGARGRRPMDPLSKSDHGSSKFTIGLAGPGQLPPLKRGRRPNGNLRSSEHNFEPMKPSFGITRTHSGAARTVKPKDPLSKSDHGIWTSPGQIHGLPVLRKTRQDDGSQKQ